MVLETPSSFVTTVRDRCRVCYTCVRECPAKAIRIADARLDPRTGTRRLEATILGERCINCGNCVKVCSQHAKQPVSSVAQVRALLLGPGKVAACLAPSFPAEFAEVTFDVLVGMLRKLGFNYVHEVGFGADLVARRYRALLRESPARRYIATTCPALVAYVERYHAELLDSLAPVVSPMLASARAIRRLFGADTRIVFIGPCIAKKQEASDDEVAGEVDEVLTFLELREMLVSAGISAQDVAGSDFDPPHANLGALFPISRGLLQAAGMQEDLLTGDVVTTDGRNHFVEAIKEFQSGSLDAKLLDILCCHGCIAGAGASHAAPLFSRRSRVSQYVRHRMAGFDRPAWEKAMAGLADLDISRRFTPRDQRIPVPFADEIVLIMNKMGKFDAADELNCGACGYDTCREHAVAIFKGLAETEMCLPYTIEQLRKTVGELATSNQELADAQQALMQSEKLASMGQLAAGIAHEVNNPLGVVLMYSHLLLEENATGGQLKEDLTLIADQADRCKKIVAGLLNFARQNKVVFQSVNVPELVERVARTAGAPENVTVEVRDEMADPLAEVDRDQIAQVLTNLISNAVAAMPEGGTLTVGAAGDAETARLTVTDTGVGIPKENLPKIFEPFFTTKQIGKGTGLGLAVTYGIVKMHRGDIAVASNADPAAGPTGSTFTVTLPRKGKE
jgi:signal transduction histidine kinase/iron only hydrogenase large subunit-like protein